MILRHALNDYLDTFLACGAVTDYAPNGLQIEGRDTIHRLCTAVSITRDVIAAAVDWKADAILVHHGFFWRGESAVMTGVKRQRIGALMRDDINFFAYHLPLDLHLQLGNNACIAALLKAEQVSQHDVGSLKKGLWAGSLPNALSSADFVQHLEDIFKRPPLHIPAQIPHIKRIAWCSGAAQDFLVDAKQLGVDAYISGEVSERTFDLAKELNIHYFSCGHHATERYGVQALGDHLAQTFELEHRFIDSENPI